MTIEVKIGISYSAREIVLDSPQTAEAVTASVEEALKDGGVLSLTDDRGRLVLVPVEKLTYVEIGSQDRGRVGFAN